jgi:23S rRNA (adenine2503-C2)-methyltransferase
MLAVDRPHLLGLLPADLVRHLDNQGVPVRPAEARRILAHVITAGQPGFPRARPVPARVEEAVTATTRRAPLEVLERATDPADGFVKYLLRAPDGALSEVVRIPLERPGCFTVCLSSQVGCAMGCAFCATGRLGLHRNLEAWEMVSAFGLVRGEAPGRVTGAVFMGQGEPLHNYDAVLQAAAVLADPCGGRIRAEAISLSTVGLVPAMRRFAREGHPFRLITSLTSAIDERRAELLPAAARWPLAEVAAALGELHAATGDRVTVAWVVLGGVNTGPEEVEALGALMKGVPFRLNLIDVNDPRPDGFVRASAGELATFRDRLRALGVPVVRRYSGGAATHAACGMLASRRVAPAPSALSL